MASFDFEKLNSFFHNFDINLVDRIELINKNYETDCNIIANFDNQYNVITHSCKLNEYRQKVISDLKENLELKIKEINERPNKILNQFFFANLKQEILIHKNFYSTNYAAQLVDKLIRFEFNEILDFYKLNKYSDLVLSTTEINFNYSSTKLYGFIANKSFILPSNKVMILFTNTKALVSIFNYRGESLLNKELGSINEYDIEIRTTSTKIVVIKKEPSISFKTIIEVLNFNLELVFKFTFEDMNYSDFLVNNNEIVFVGADKLIAFDLNLLKIVKIKFQNENEKDPYYVWYKKDFNVNQLRFCCSKEAFKKTSTLCHVNKEKFYFRKKCFKDEYKDYIYLIDRRNGRNQGSLKINFDSDYYENGVEFDNSSNIYDLNMKKRIVKVYNSNAKLIFNINLNEKICGLSITLFNKFIFNHILTQWGNIQNYNNFFVENVSIEFISF